MRSERLDLGSESPYLGLRGLIWGLKSLTWGLRPDLDLRGLIWGLKGLIWGLRGLVQGLEEGGWKTETREICPMWNHRSSIPPGPLPKRDRPTDGWTNRGEESRSTRLKTTQNEVSCSI